MSDERKELTKRLDEYFIDNVIGASQKDRDLFREVRLAIEQEPEIEVTGKTTITDITPKLPGTVIKFDKKINYLKFSAARAIEMLFENSINKSKLKMLNCVFNFLHYAEKHGWLNVEKIHKDLTPSRVTKIIKWNNMQGGKK